MHKQGQCTDLIETTANELGDDVVALMLLAVQRGNLEFNIREAIRRYVYMRTATSTRKVYRRNRTDIRFKQGTVSTEKVIKICILGFPSLWVSRYILF
jgi:hypothetical protein